MYNALYCNSTINTIPYNVQYNAKYNTSQNNTFLFSILSLIGLFYIVAGFYSTKYVHNILYIILETLCSGNKSCAKNFKEVNLILPNSWGGGYSAFAYTGN